MLLCIYNYLHVRRFISCESNYNKVRNRSWNHTWSIHPFHTSVLYPLPCLCWSMPGSWGPCCGHVEPLLSSCWAIRGLSWAYVGGNRMLCWAHVAINAMLGLNSVYLWQIWRCWWDFIRAILGYVERVLGHVGVLEGSCWAIVAPFGWYSRPIGQPCGPKKSSTTTPCCWGFFWPDLGPFGSQVGPMLGLSWSMFGSLGAMLGHVEPMLNLFWALVGPN